MERIELGEALAAGLICSAPPPMGWPGRPAPHEAEEAALYLPGRWGPQVRRLPVRFLDGDAHVQRRVVEVICGPLGWNAVCGLQFVFTGQADAPIRVTFAPGGSWSYLGTAMLAAPPHAPTMQLGWLRPDTPEEEARRVILHEFGHALGLGHEHESPPARIPWRRAVVYEAYRLRSGWPREVVDAQVFTPLAADETEATAYDPASIMHYHIPAAWVQDGRERGGASRLSASDVAAVRLWYGPPPAEQHLAEQHPAEQDPAGQDPAGQDPTRQGPSSACLA